FTIKEKLETIDYLLSKKEYSDLNSLRSLLEELIELNLRFMEEVLKKEKEKKKIRVIPKVLENKKVVYLSVLREKGFKDEEIEQIGILIELKNAKLLREKFLDQKTIKKFLNLIQKIYDII
ncbi:MAG: hypothetical protein ABGW69_01470, partial [Nanoarchaeota archaeon]